ncbi:MAG: alpha-hydroxy-acid oxidizing protein, partial [Halobacteria archaeon]|nr:alpha-hydroxy-acid oxidizing protein [Halobacteria archaeon]
TGGSDGRGHRLRPGLRRRAHRDPGGGAIRAVAKAVALGARAGGLAKPFLGPGARGDEEAVEAVEEVVSELRTAMFVTGSDNIDELSRVETVVTGKTKEYLSQIRLD